jgi:itaconyl-CoA hydratase
VSDQAPKEWRGRFSDDLTVGDVFRSRLGRTITEADNVWFTCLTMNTNQIHFNVPFAEATRFGKPIVNSTLTLAIVTGLTVADTSENGGINLEWTDIKLPRPVFVGDTIWAESEILDLKPSRSDEGVSIVSMRCRGVNQQGEVVCEFRRTFMLPTQVRADELDVYPGTEDPWSV